MMGSFRTGVRDQVTQIKLGSVVMYTTARYPWISRYRAESVDHRSLGVFDTRPAAEHRVRLHASVEAVDECAYRLQWCQDGVDITIHPGCEQDADEVTVWSGAHGDTPLYTLVVAPRGWRFSEGHESNWERLRFATPEGALDYAGKQIGVRFREAVCRCGEPDGVCD